MHRNLFAPLPLLAILLLAAVGLPAHATTSCTAGNPNTTSVIESTPTSDFAINGNGTVTHAKTGLIWKQCPEGFGFGGGACFFATDAKRNWQGALKAANAANTAAFAGYTDWRLPNKKELESIVESCGWDPAINQTVFSDSVASAVGFWSSSSYVADPAKAWIVYFLDGHNSANSKTANGPYVRLVRGGQSVDSFDSVRAKADALLPVIDLLLLD